MPRPCLHELMHRRLSDEPREPGNAKRFQTCLIAQIAGECGQTSAQCLYRFPARLPVCARRHAAALAEALREVAGGRKPAGSSDLGEAVVRAGKQFLAGLDAHVSQIAHG